MAAWATHLPGCTSVYTMLKWWTLPMAKGFCCPWDAMCALPALLTAILGVQVSFTCCSDLSQGRGQGNDWQIHRVIQLISSQFTDWHSPRSSGMRGRQMPEMSFLSPGRDLLQPQLLVYGGECFSTGLRQCVCTGMNVTLGFWCYICRPLIS